MSTYIQYDGANNQTTLAERLLNNTSDYICVRVGEREYLFLSGEMSQNGRTVTYEDCKKWEYETYSYSGTSPTLKYTESDSGTVTLLENTSYVYSSLSGYPHLNVKEVVTLESYTNLALLGFLVVSAVFAVFRRVRGRLQ